MYLKFDLYFNKRLRKQLQIPEVSEQLRLAILVDFFPV